MSRLGKKIFFPDEAFEPYLRSATPQLPFTVRPVTNSEELLRVAEVRLTAYRSNAANTGSDTRSLSDAIDIEDYAPNSVVLAAFDKGTDDILGTLRIAFSNRGATTMQSVAGLPDIWATRPYGEARLLCVPTHDQSRMILLMLCKAFYQACRKQEIDHMLIGSRRAMQPFYEFLCFSDIALEPVFFTPPNHDLQHRIMSLRIDDLEKTWQAAPGREVLKQIFFDQHHTDIALADADSTNPLHELPPPTFLGETLNVSDMVVLVR